MQVTERVDVEYVGKTWCEKEILEETGKDVPRITLNATIMIDHRIHMLATTYVEEGRSQVNALKEA
jgi:hypothetical protein